MIWLCEDVLRCLGVEPEWTVVAEDGVGFVSGELGVWLTARDPESGPPLLRTEIRFALGVPEREDNLSVLDTLNHRGSVGRWVHEPATGTVAVVASIDLTAVLRESAGEVGAEVVSALVVRAEDLAFRSVPQRYLDGRKALTLIGDRRRDHEDRFLRERFKRQLQAGAEPGAARRVLPLVQDVLLYLAPGWTLDHRETMSWCTDSKGLGMAVRVAEHPTQGYGLMIAAGPEKLFDASQALVAQRAACLNRFYTATPGLGAWASGLGGLEYRVFVPSSLVELVERDLPEPRLLSAAVREVVERIEWWAASDDLDTSTGPLLAHPAWDGDQTAEIIARRDPINDGLDAPDSYVWLDSLGRAAASTEGSYQLWRSRLIPADLDDPGVAGFSRWFEGEVAHRHGQGAQ